MTKKKSNKEIGQLKTELAGLKKRLRQIENFLLNFPNPEHYLGIRDTDIEEDELFDKATQIAKQYKRVSTSLLQRKLSIGYARAVRLLGQLEKKGVISPSKED